MTTMIHGVLPPPKQIRFVHNQGQPPTKRRRVNAACLTCRRRKTRCAGERPVCSTCTKNGHTCLGYNEVVERKRDHGGGAKGRIDGSIEEEDEYLDEDENDEDERPHWAGRKTEGQLTNGATRPRRESESAPRPDVSRRRNDAGPEEEQRHGRRSEHLRSASYSEDRSSTSRSPMQRHTESRRVPYFRYFGPTAIVPGFKQMVVSVRDRRRSTGGSFSATSPSSAIGHTGMLGGATQADDGVATIIDDLPTYDPNDSGPVPPLILGLVKTFFHHLGCNYPFLKEEKFYRMVREKRVEPILVDAVCALAARFSDAPLFPSADGKVARSEFGQIFASRAKAATVDTFPCPSVGAVQACLLMAYEGFGANQDSALWMYLGLAIRMAVDLGLQKMVGVKYQGEKDPWYTRHLPRGGDAGMPENKVDGGDLSHEEQLEVEQERIDTFWAVFTLDRVISSGTGRPVTFRDDDFELGLPEPFIDPVSGWPDPSPHFIKIIHLYGRVSDVLNNIRNADDLTTEKWNKLARMENELTRQYQDLGQRLEFNAGNFRMYVNAGKGTTFILLHFWFHALIIILHQPTLLAPFGGLSRTHQLLPNSRELSMSSAKTIADILAFAELIDPKSFIGNPFTSQPMYIGACAFLMESVANASEPPSREGSPPLTEPRAVDWARPTTGKHAASDAKSSKHSLLASAANQNYQRCYNSLQQLNAYWGGVKYILTALDQKSKGIWDCETYTSEEYESTKFRRRGSMSRFPRFENPASPNIPPIAWSLTGTTNSPNSNLTLMYGNMTGGASQPLQSAQSLQPPFSVATPPRNAIYDPIRQNFPETPSMFPPAYPQPTTSAVRNSPRPSKPHRLSTSSLSSVQTQSKAVRMPAEEVSTPPSSVDQASNMHMLGSLPQTFTPSSQQSSTYEASIMPSASPASSTLADTPHPNNSNATNGGNTSAAGYDGGFHFGIHGHMPYMGPTGPITDVITFDSQEIDIGALGLQNEMMPSWLEYLPVTGLFDNPTMGGGG